MANRYWVGAGTSWTTANTASWSATDGGAGGASVPTSADDVFFTNLSGNCAFTTGIAAKSITCQGAGPYAGTWSGTGIGLSVYGNLALSASMTITISGGTLTLLNNGPSPTTSITSAGKSISCNLTVNLGSNTPTLNLNDAFSIGNSATLTVTSGNFTTNNYTVTCGSFAFLASTGSGSANFGSSTINILTPAGTALNLSGTGTLNAGTSQIIISGTASTMTISGAAKTLYNVSFTGSTVNSISISAPLTYNNLSISGRTSTGVSSITLSANQTVNGTLTVSAGLDASSRIFILSSPLGTTRQLVCAAATLTSADFRDIAVSGSAAPIGGTSIGDCKGNSGITFTTAAPKYWNLAAGGNWNAVAWATTSGGTPAMNNFPLAQDTCIFQATGLNSGATVTVNSAYTIGAIDMSARTANTMTLATGSNTPVIYGSWTNGTGTTITGTTTLTFAGRGNQTITSAGKTFTQAITINSPGGSVTLQDAFITSSTVSPAITHTAGDFFANGYNLTATGFNSSAVNTKTIGIGSGTWTLTGTGSMFSASSSVTVTGTGTIRLTSASAKTFNGAGIQTYPTITQGGTGTLTITGSNKFANITNTAIGRVQFTGGTTNEFTAFNLNGVLGSLLPVGSTNTTQAILKAPSWNVGANSTDAGNNTGLSFTAGTVDYLSISYVNGVIAVGPILVYIIESATASSAESPTGTYNPSVSETTALADSAIAGMLYLGELSESATVADSVSAFRAFLAAVIEAAVSAEVTQAASALSAALAEVVQAAETTQASAALNASVQELAQGADATTRGLLFLSSVLEASQAQELAAAVAAFNRSVSESASSIEAVSVVASTFSAAALNTATARDATQGANTGTSNLSENATGSESSAAKFIALTGVAESSAAQEFSSAAAVFQSPIAESSVAQDQTRVAPSNFSAVALAAAQAAESFNPAGSIYNAVLPIQGVGITDSFIGAYLWNPIDDNQTANWQNVSNSQGSGWVQVPTDDAPNWQPTIEP